LKNAPIHAGAIVSAAASPQAALVQTKLSHDVAKYQDQPKNGQKCSTCLQFVPPEARGPDQAEWMCQFYGPKTT
jgi:hypothetical protein